MDGNRSKLPTRVLDCPRGGWMCLTTKWAALITVPTVCQTWRCPRCGPKRKAFASMRCEHGSIFLAWPGPLRLITLTYRRVPSETVVDARSALADFRRFVQLYRRRSHGQLRWFRVPEVTRRGQVHWHVISGDLVGNRRECEQLIRDCWALASRRKGVVINYVVDVSETTASGSARYITKYLLKTALTFETLEERGFKRRWTCSRDWTKPARLELRGTAENAWLRHEWVAPRVAHADVAAGRELARTSRLADRVGDDLVLTLQKRDRKRSIARALKGAIGASK